MGKGNPHRRPAPARRIPNTRTRTRLQKRKLADPAQNSHDLALQLRSLGLYAANTLGDGNCLFRALCDQLYGSPKEHLNLRQEICDWMDTYRDYYQGFVEDGRTWEQHIGSMRQSGTYGGHLELSAFAHLKQRNVKVIQPGLVYVIEWSTGPNASGEDASVASTSAASTSMASDVSGASLENNSLTGREARRARRERLRETKEAERRKAAAARLAEPQPAVDDGPAPHTLPAIYVAYHDWEHFSSVRNLTGPHQGVPNVIEAPAPPEDQPSPPAASRRQKKNTLASRPRSRSPSPATTTSTQTTDASSLPSSASPQTPPDSQPSLNAASAIFKSRSPKRSFEESEDTLAGDASGSDYSRKRSRGQRGIIVNGEDDDELLARRPAPPSSIITSSATTDDEGADDDDDEGRSTPDSSASQSVSSLARRPSTRLHKRPGQAPKSKPKPRRVVLLVGGQKAGKVRQKKSSTIDASSADSGKAEWVQSGMGRVDVRGFRELKI